MSLSHAILTSLLEKPCTGAELARRFDKSLGHFWQATHQQIYRELGKLEAAALVEPQELPTTRGQQRLFTVLGAGRSELEGWCVREADPRPIRDELLVRMRAAAVLGTVDVTMEMRRHRGLHEATLARYLAIEAADFPAGAARSRPDELQRAVLLAGVAFEQAWLAWCDDALEELGDRGSGPQG